MFCAVYKSNKKALTYLYVCEKDKFSDVPEKLITQFGKPIFVMMLDLNQRKRLATANIEIVKNCLQSDGYYLQLPPSENRTISYS